MKARTERSAPVERMRGIRLACVVSSYHSEITHGMVDSARETLQAAGLPDEALLVFEVPGAYELPVVAQRLAERADIAAVLCFGLVLKGETEHDRYIASAVADGLIRISLDTHTPCLFGVLTCATLEQAQARARRTSDGGLDKGQEVAQAAIEVIRTLDTTRPTPTKQRTS